MRSSNDAHLRIPLAMVPLAALLLTTGPLFAQRSKPPLRPPVSTAANLPAHLAVKRALKVALGDAAIRAEAHRIVSDHLENARPFAVVSGYWVVSYPLRNLYTRQTIKAALLSTLGANGQQIIDAAVSSTDHSRALILVPFASERFFRISSQNLRAAVGNVGGPFVSDVTLFTATIILSLSIDVSRVTGVDTSSSWHYAVADSERDIDDDNQVNRVDDDDDGDGKVDFNDDYPFDPARYVCGCARDQAIAFTFNVPRDFLPDLIPILDAARAALPNGISLGVATPFVASHPTNQRGAEMTVVF